jgi:hypothetical protein
MASPGFAPTFRIVRLAAWVLLPIPIAALCFLAVLPRIFGEDVGAGFASVERSLCALGSDGSAEILVGGDSRAKIQVDPILLEELTGKRSVNVAEDITFGGDLPTLVNALRNNPAALAKKPIIIVSVSVTGFNDLALKDLPAASVLNWSFTDHARVAFRRPGNYFRFLIGWYVPFLKRHVVHKLRGTHFRCEDGLDLPPSLLATRGFRPTQRKMDSIHIGTASRPHTQADFLLDGGRRKAFSRALDWLDASPARAILLYNAPIYRNGLSDTVHGLEMEYQFADLVAAEAARHTKVQFTDFVRNPPPELDPIHFADSYHLNEIGAALFTRRLAALLMDSVPSLPKRVQR